MLVLGSVWEVGVGVQLVWVRSGWIEGEGRVPGGDRRVFVGTPEILRPNLPISVLLICLHILQTLAPTTRIKTDSVQSPPASPQTKSAWSTSGLRPHPLHPEIPTEVCSTAAPSSSS